MPNPKLETYKNKATGDVYDYTDADAQGKLTAILDGTTIDSFADVESALADKVDAVAGKGLSTNDYDNTAKGIVDNIQSNVIANTKLIKDTVGWSGKNKLTPQWNRASGASAGNVTMTYGSDRIISLSGTAGAGAEFDIKRRVPNNNDTDYYLPIGKYKYTIGESIPSGFSVYVATTYNGLFKNISGNACAGGVEFEITANTQSDYKKSDGSTLVALYFSVTNGTNTSGVKLYPMIRPADILDPTYEPYFSSTAFPRSEQAVLGAKNLHPKYKNATSGSAVMSVDDDGICTITGTSGSGDGILSDFVLDLPAGCYTLTDEAIHTNVTYCQIQNVTKSVIYWTPNNNTTFEYNGTDTLKARIWLKGGSLILNEVLKPMLRLATDPDDTYVPHVMTNNELTEDREYHAGDVIKVAGPALSGYVTSGATEIKLSIPLTKNIGADVTDSVLSNGDITVRGIAGYVLQNKDLSELTVTKDIFGNKSFASFTIKNTDNSAFNVTNNTPLSIQLNNSVVTLS